VETQLNVLVQHEQLTDVDYGLRESICHGLLCLFTPMFPGCVIHPFGSSANYLGMRGCDMDIYLDICLEEQSAELAPVIKKIARQLDSNRREYADVCPIRSARCPVVKFTHKPTGIHCDITVNNRLALRNTELIQFIVTFDKERLHPLIFTIRYWAKLMQVSGSGAKLTSYAVTLLVIFYLQNTQPAVLPSVEKLSQLAVDKRQVNGWDCSFTTNPSLLTRDNSSSTVELLIGFFKFFASFNFQSKVVCPRTAQALDHSAFLNCLQSHQQCSTFTLKSLSVQDPFVLDHNTTSNVNDKTLDRMIQCLQQTADRCTCQHFNDFTLKPSGLTYLLSPVTVQQRLLSRSLSMLPDSHNSTTHMFSVNFDLATVSADSDVSVAQHLWSVNVAAMLRAILVDILDFCCLTRSQPTDELKHELANFGHVLLPHSALLSYISSPSQNTVQSPTIHNATSSHNAAETLSYKATTTTSPFEPPMSCMLLSVSADKICSTKSSTSAELSPHAACTTKRLPIGCHDDDGSNDAKRSRLTNVSDEFVDRSSNEFRGHCSAVSDDDITLTTGHSASCTDTSSFICSSPVSDSSISQSQNALLLFCADCSSVQRLWINRKKLRRKMASLYSHEYQREVEISKALKATASLVECEASSLSSGPSPAPVIQFEIAVFSDLSNKSVRTILRPREAMTKEFPCFFIFFKSLALKLIDRCVLSGATSLNEGITQT
jgi:hypothetical protein